MSFFRVDYYLSDGNREYNQELTDIYQSKYYQDSNVLRDDVDNFLKEQFKVLQDCYSGCQGCCICTNYKYIDANDRKEHEMASIPPETFTEFINNYRDIRTNTESRHDQYNAVIWCCYFKTSEQEAKKDYVVFDFMHEWYEYYNESDYLNKMLALTKLKEMEV